MTFKSYPDACRKISAWCEEESKSCTDAGEKFMCADAAGYWRERARVAEADESPPLKLGRGGSR